jgi:uncharacterized membrane protein YdjX (TVP38/TMEM64 family)
MNKSLLIKRTIPIEPGCEQLQVETVSGVLKATSGIENVLFDKSENILSVEYDFKRISYSQIGNILSDQKINRAHGIRQRLLSIWYDYLDTTARDNALAPPAACCNKPPRRRQVKSSYLKLVPAFSIITILVIAYFVLANSSFVELFADMELLAVKARHSGIYGPLLLMALMALAIVFNPLPSAPIALVAGAVYGHTYGTIYVVVGAELGAIIAFLIARIAGYELASKYLGRNLTFGRFGSQNALTAIVFISRLIPFMSFDLVSYAAGLTPIKFWRFGVATLLGLIPVSFVLAHMGGEFITTDKSNLLVIALFLGLLTLVPLLLIYLRKPVSNGNLDNTENRR